jgi:serine/threonine protein phosphatase PrpC
MIPAERAHLQATVVTHPGMKGKQNEDRYGVSAHVYNPQNPIPSTLAIISDGIGGHRAGEVAAEMAVEIISRKIAESSPFRPQASLKAAIIAASQAVREQAQKDPSKRGMGATCACAWIIGNRLYTASVGDSRVYLIRKERIRQLTVDHTWIQEAVDKGLLTFAEAAGHPNQHVIRRFLGSESPPLPDMRLFLEPDDSDEEAKSNQGMRLDSGDCLLLCSDGLTDLVADWEILARVKQLHIEEALSGLVDLANGRGGHDNITILALQVPEHFPPQAEMFYEAATVPVAVVGPKRQTISNTKKAILSCLGLSILLVIGLLVATSFGWLALGGPPASTPTLTEAPTLTQTVVTIEIIAPIATLALPPTQTPTTVPVQVQPTYTAWPTSTSSTSPVLQNTAIPTPTPSSTEP